jgi:hypothetical protein
MKKTGHLTLDDRTMCPKTEQQPPSDMVEMPEKGKGGGRKEEEKEEKTGQI